MHLSLSLYLERLIPDNPWPLYVSKLPHVSLPLICIVFNFADNSLTLLFLERRSDGGRSFGDHREGGGGPGHYQDGEEGKVREKEPDGLIGIFAVKKHTKCKVHIPTSRYSIPIVTPINNEIYLLYPFSCFNNHHSYIHK